jgi:Nuclease-related domain
MLLTIVYATYHFKKREGKYLGVAEKVMKASVDKPFYVIGIGFLLSYFAGNIDGRTLAEGFTHIGMSIVAFLVCLLGTVSVNIKYEKYLGKGNNTFDNVTLYTIAPAFVICCGTIAWVGGGGFFNGLFLILGLIGTGFMLFILLIGGMFLLLVSSIAMKFYTVLLQSIRFVLAVLSVTFLLKGDIYIGLFFIVLFLVEKKLDLFSGQIEKEKEIIIERTQPKKENKEQETRRPHKPIPGKNAFVPSHSNQSQSKELSVDERIRQVGEDGEKRVRFGLQMLQDFDGYKTYNDFYIVADNGFRQQIDHMVVGKNGVFHLETKTFKGDYEIKPDGSWCKHYNGTTTAVDNPTSQMERHELVIHSVLKDVLPKGVSIQHILTLGTENVKDITLRGKEYSKYPVVHHKDITSYIRNQTTQRELTSDEIYKIHQKIMKHLRNEKWTPKDKK